MSEKKTTRVFIADDHAIMRKGLRDLIAAEKEFEVCGEAGNGLDALQKIEELRPDVVLTDIDMPQMSGIEIAKVIRSKKLNCKVIILSMHSDESFFSAAMDAGVVGYVLKDGAVSDIVNAIIAVTEGKYYISPALSTFTIDRAHNITSTNDGTSVLSLLTQTERKVLQLVSQNKSTKEIAEELFVSHRTIDSHRSNISSKLNLQGQNALLRFALENKHKL
ncbi:MAG: response regulator transcription factor [Bacteroidota bacterium]|jgi:DNA-binding NarL/FixJ family response regulator